MSLHARRAALVTGADNDGMLEVVRALCTQFDGVVVITAIKSVNNIIRDLNQTGLHPVFHQLDINDQGSVDSLKTFLHNNYGGLDVLVHNAAVIKFPRNSGLRFTHRVKKTMEYNFVGSLSLCRSLWSLLRPHSRVCIVIGSRLQSIFSECSLDLQSQLKDNNLTMAKLELLMGDFLRDGQRGAHFRNGWPTAEFALSQLGAYIMSAILEREAVDDARGDVTVISCWPGQDTTDISCCQIPVSTDNKWLPW